MSTFEAGGAQLPSSPPPPDPELELADMI